MAASTRSAIGRPAAAIAVAGTTANKSASSFTVTGLTPGQTYDLRIRTYTPAHNDVPAYQQNALWSDYAAVTAHTPSGSLRKIHLPFVPVR